MKIATIDGEPLTFEQMSYLVGEILPNDDFDAWAFDDPATGKLVLLDGVSIDDVSSPRLREEILAQ